MRKLTLLLCITIGMMGTMMAANAVSVNNKVCTIIADEYVKVKSSELTPPVIEEILKQYPTSKLGGVYKNSQGEFKLIMVLKSGTRRTVYIDKHGNWITKRKSVRK